MVDLSGSANCVGEVGSGSEGFQPAAGCGWGEKGGRQESVAEDGKVVSASEEGEGGGFAGQRGFGDAVAEECCGGAICKECSGGHVEFGEDLFAEDLLKRSVALLLDSESEELKGCVRVYWRGV